MNTQEAVRLTHSQFMKLAWARAKELAGGSKGSKKFLSQAMRENNRSKTSMLITESQYKQLFNLLAQVKKMENDETFGKTCNHWTALFETQLKSAISDGTLYNDDGYIETKTYPSFGKGLFIKNPHTETVVLVKELSDVRKNFENKSGSSAIAWKKYPASIEAAIELTTLTKILLLA